MKKSLIRISIIICVVAVVVWWRAMLTEKPVVVPIKETPTSVVPSKSNEKPTPVETKPVSKGFELLKLETTALGAELAKYVGSSNVALVLALNRLDDKNLKQGMTLVVPTTKENFKEWEFMPSSIASAETIPKLVIVSQKVQSFGVYEFGKLVRSGPVSSGKQSTPTPSKLFFTNWKGKEVVSTVDDEWILKWNFNLDNFEGVALHQYALPGYPASHSCVRFYAWDAEWIYNWADQWVLSGDGKTKLASGTPVIIYGAYDFKSTAPWKQLVTNPDATTVSQEELEALVTKNISEIEKEAALRAQVLGAQ